MKFDDAWEAALKKIPEEDRPKGDPKMIALIWSIVAVALNEKEKCLDDISYIDNNQRIISIPLQKSTKEKTAKDKPKPVKENVETNGKEKKTKEPKPETTEKST